jgi:hypothetical protein
MHYFFKVVSCSAGEGILSVSDNGDLELFQPKPCSNLNQLKPMQISHPSLREAFKIIFFFSHIAQGMPFL